MNEANGSWQPTRWGSNSGGYDGPTNPPVHVSINQSLPPIAVPQQPLDWRNRSTSRQQYQQVLFSFQDFFLYLIRHQKICFTENSL